MRMINDKCNNCGNCIVECLSNAITPGDIYRIDKTKCIDCMACVKVCSQKAIVEYIEPIEGFEPETNS
jgi:ferredoxin